MLRMLILFLLLAAPAMAETRPQGLMWNRSGLPATLPLQVRSDAGQDYFLTLIDPDTGKAVLAAYVRGGSVFRVLVPPGDWRVALAQGSGWRGEKALFGAQTRHIRIDTPLHFGVGGVSRRVGNLIDLRGGGDKVQTFGLCRAVDAPTAAEAPARPKAPTAHPVPAPAPLAETRRPKQVLPPPDQPPPTTPEGALKPFAQPFAERPRAPAAAPSAPRAQVPKFGTIRPQGSAKPRNLPRWKICD